MDVTFTKMPGRRYMMTVVRERGPELAPRQGPGYDDHLPHDAVHFLVECEARLTGGVFGRLAAGWSNLFWPADPAVRRRQARREAKRSPSRAEHADMARSERLASLSQSLWEFRAGHRSELPPALPLLVPETVEEALLERIVTRLDEFAACWHALPEGDSVTLSWPAGAHFRKPAGRTEVRPGTPARGSGRTAGRTPPRHTGEPQRTAGGAAVVAASGIRPLDTTRPH